MARQPKTRTVFVCDSCGNEYSKWEGRCRSCGEYNTMGEDMLKAGIPVVLIDKPDVEQATLHHKVIVIDGERVIMGSPNLSSTALNKSDEDVLTIDSADIAKRFLDEIEEIK
ncbi:MAG: phospholipase D-like domain-containing protein, partial [SAR202 cluster bacterium]|nr:phospholipase D-like domain-containing protein [SAR202 cluster bacterium]